MTASITDIRDIENEMLVFMRANLTDPKSRMSTQTDQFNGDGHTLTFTLSQLTCRAVTAVSVSGATKSFGVDYTVNYQNATPSSYPTITFITAPGVGSNNISVTYLYGETWIYPDYPRTDLSLNNYPRVAVTLTSARTSPLGIGGVDTISDYLMTVGVYADSGETVNSLINQARSLIIQNIKNFYYVKQVYPTGISPMGMEPQRHEKIKIKSADFALMFVTDRGN